LESKSLLCDIAFFEGFRSKVALFGFRNPQYMVEGGLSRTLRCTQDKLRVGTQDREVIGSNSNDLPQKTNPEVVLGLVHTGGIRSHPRIE